jgi:hypothetical protein
MKKAIIVLSLCSSVLPGLAQADELDDYTDKLLKIVPSKCFDEAANISGNHVRRTLPDLFLVGPRTNNKAFDDAWRAGDEKYRQAHDMLEMALQDEEASNGPLIDIGLRHIVRTAVGKWTPAERAEYLAFVKQKDGRMAWDFLVDGAMCSGVIKSVTKPPLPLSEGEDRKRLDVLAIEAELRDKTIRFQLSAMSKEQQAKVDRVGPGLVKSITAAYQATNEAWLPRATRAADTVLPEVKKIIAFYKQ